MNKERSTLLLVVGRDSSFQGVLQIYLKNIGFRNLLVAKDYETALNLFRENQPDLALIEIDFDNSGINLAKSFNSIVPIPIVFITANYNAKVYELAKKVNPIAFINKEISELKLKQVIELGLIHSSKNALLPNPPTAPSTPIHEEIFVKIGNVLKKFLLSDIDWFGVDGKYAYAQSGGKKFPLSLSLKDLEEKLGQKEFFRIHQSYMVNIKKIQSVNTVKNIIVIKGEELPIGRSFKKNLLNRIQYF
ncbi:MAG: LytTR family DNA-binding domain-containing protein [Bacteroidota bacterium]